MIGGIRIMKIYLYPLLVVIAASSYGLVSTIIKLAMRSGFSASEAVTSQFFSVFVSQCVFSFLQTEQN